MILFLKIFLVISGMFFINVNDFHHFKTIDLSNFQPQPTSLIAQSVSSVFDRTLFQSMTLIKLSQIESSRDSDLDCLEAHDPSQSNDGKLFRHYYCVK